MKLIRFTLLGATLAQNTTEQIGSSSISTRTSTTTTTSSSSSSTTTISTTTTTRVIMGEEAGDELFHACEKYYVTSPSSM